MRVMIVVPAFAPAQQRDPPAIGGKIASLKPSRAPRMSGRVYQPSEMQAHDRPEENSPQDELPSAYCKQDQPENDHRHVVIFRDPDVELVLGQVRDVSGERGCIVVHGFAHQDPAHMRPPFAVNW